MQSCNTSSYPLHAEIERELHCLSLTYNWPYARVWFPKARAQLAIQEFPIASSDLIENIDLNLCALVKEVKNSSLCFVKNSSFQYQMQFDQWFVPALAICIFFLVVYGIYHILVLPRFHKFHVSVNLTLLFILLSTNMASLGKFLLLLWSSYRWLSFSWYCSPFMLISSRYAIIIH